jgi:hypothetical protein
LATKNEKELTVSYIYISDTYSCSCVYIDNVNDCFSCGGKNGKVCTNSYSYTRDNYTGGYVYNINYLGIKEMKKNLLFLIAISAILTVVYVHISLILMTALAAVAKIDEDVLALIAIPAILLVTVLHISLVIKGLKK